MRMSACMPISMSIHTLLHVHRHVLRIYFHASTRMHIAIFCLQPPLVVVVLFDVEAAVKKGKIGKKGKNKAGAKKGGVKKGGVKKAGMPLAPPARTHSCMPAQMPARPHTRLPTRKTPTCPPCLPRTPCKHACTPPSLVLSQLNAAKKSLKGGRRLLSVNDDIHGLSSIAKLWCDRD